MSSNGAGSRGGSSAVLRGGTLQQKVIDSPSWDVRMKRCEVAKGELNEVRVPRQLDLTTEVPVCNSYKTY